MKNVISELGVIEWLAEAGEEAWANEASSRADDVVSAGQMTA